MQYRTNWFLKNYNQYQCTNNYPKRAPLRLAKRFSSTKNIKSSKCVEKNVKTRSLCSQNALSFLETEAPGVLKKIYLKKVAFCQKKSKRENPLISHQAFQKWKNFVQRRIRTHVYLLSSPSNHSRLLLSWVENTQVSNSYGQSLLRKPFLRSSYDNSSLGQLKVAIWGPLRIDASLWPEKRKGWLWM